MYPQNKRPGTHLRINKKRERKFVESEKRRRHEFLTGCENKAGDYPWPIYRKDPYSLLPEPFNRKIISFVRDMSSVEKGDGAEVYFVIAQRACCVNSRRLCHRRVYIHDFLALLYSVIIEILKEVNSGRGMHTHASWWIPDAKRKWARGAGAHLACSCVLAGGLNSPKGATGCCKKANTPCASSRLDKLTDAKWVYWMTRERGGVRVWMRPQGGFCLIPRGICLFWLERWK